MPIINFKDLVFLIYPQNLIIKVRQMNLDITPFDSPQKETRRSSILKHRTDNKENMKPYPKGLSTTIRHSVRFKEQQQQNNVRQFNQSNPKFQVQKSQRNIVQKEQLAADKSYTKRCFFKDVNNINYLYSNVLMMAAQNSRKTSEKCEHRELIQLNKAIQELVYENKQLKAQIEEKHTIQNDLFELGEYLHCSVDDLIHRNQLESFIEEYLRKQEECKELQQRCRNMEDQPKHKIIGFNQAYIKQKQKKCQVLRKRIDREKNAIKKLQKEEAQLLKNLYKSQKEIVKNDRLSSALKLKINQIEIDNEYRFSKARARTNVQKILDKESLEIVGELKHCKVTNKQNLKSKVSIPKLMKKR